MVKVDSARSLAPYPVYYESMDANGYGYQSQYRNLNIASVRNQGWELQGTANIGPFTARGTYSWTKSRAIGVDAQYRSIFTALNYPQYQPGATFNLSPEHTWVGVLTYSRGGTMVTVNMNGVGEIRNDNSQLYADHLTYRIRLESDLWRMYAYDFPKWNNGYAIADLNASQRLSSRIEGVLSVQNLNNNFTNDRDADYAVIGRQTRMGFRIRM
jgi:outer membrane receptor protein involved in Fe transport